MASAKLKRKTTRPSKSQPRSKSTSSKIPASSTLALKPFLLLIAGFLVLGLGLLQVESFRWLVPALAFSEGFFHFLSIAGVVLVVVGLLGFPQQAPSGDLPRWVAYPLLVLIVGVGAYLRFTRADQAYGGYWDDPATCIIDPLGAAELDNFALIYPVGAREPLYTYMAALILWLFPALKALFVQRLTANLFNLAAIWFCYLLGREASGKRLVGVLLAALVAFSKPVLLHNLSGMNALTITFSISLFLLFQVRLWKKPDVKHFLQWGAVLALGLYTYNAVRPLVVFLVITTLVWLLWKDKKEKIPTWIRGTTYLFAFCYVLFFLSNLLATFQGNPVSKLWGSSFWIWLFCQGVFLTVFLQGYKTSNEAGRRLCAWAFGLWFLGVLSYPMAMHTEAAGRIANISLLPKTASGWFSGAFWSEMTYQFTSAIQSLFVKGYDRADMNIIGDPLFDYHASVLALLGLIWAFVRLNWRKGFFILCALVGIVPYLLTSDSQSAKLLGSVVPLLLLASLALGEWMLTAWNASRGKPWPGVFLALLVFTFLGWEARGTYSRVFDTWWSLVLNDDIRVGMEVDKVLPDCRVYLVGGDKFRFFSTPTQAVLHEGNPVYYFQDANPIELKPGEERKDVVVVVSPLMPKVTDRLKKEFPHSQWTPGWQFYQASHNETPFLYSVRIPASDIPDKPGKAFQFLEYPAHDWLRRLYITGFGMRGGMIAKEDVSPTLNPVPAAWATGAVSGEGEWDAPTDGSYTFSAESYNIFQIKVDGKQVLLDRWEGRAVPESNTIFLKKGPHQIRYMTYMLGGGKFFDVTVENKDLNYKAVLGAPGS